MTAPKQPLLDLQEPPSRGSMAELPGFRSDATRSESRPRYSVLGVEVDAVQIGTAIERIEEWLFEFHSSNLPAHRSKVVTFTNVHAVIEAHKNRAVREALSNADMVCPDGMPLVWIGRRRGINLPQQVSGPEFMQRFIVRSSSKGYSHFFYGGAPGVAEKLAKVLQQHNPDLCVAGVYSPPFHSPINEQEDQQQIERVNTAKPDVLWVALGCPKQELWMEAHRDRLHVGIMLGVGQAFDILSGRIGQAPRWMRAHGLEWLYRLHKEPGRLWKRYLLTNSTFILLSLLGYLRLGGATRFRERR